MRIKAQVVAGFVEVTVPRALRFPELEQFSDGHETIPFPLEFSNGFLEHERRSLGHPIGMEQDNRAGPHLPGHPRTHTVDRVVLRRFRNHAPLDHLQALARKQCKRLVRTSADYAVLRVFYRQHLL